MVLPTLGFADLDRTLTPAFTLFPVSDALTSEGIVRAHDNERIQEVQMTFEAGEIDYKAFVSRALELMAMALKDRKVEAALHVTRRFLSSELLLYPWVLPTFNDIESRHGSLTLVSAEPDFITRAAADIFNADYLSTILAVSPDGTTYSGSIDHVLGSSQKGAQVKEKIEQGSHSEIYVFGDSAGDIGMLDLAQPPENAFCIKPDDALSLHAQTSGMTVVDDPYVARSLLAK